MRKQAIHDTRSVLRQEQTNEDQLFKLGRAFGRVGADQICRGDDVAVANEKFGGYDVNPTPLARAFRTISELGSVGEQVTGKFE
ncbi:hypothetical protein AC629_24235 [Bradyrhizobium sp. NAS80.1]|nr:hypothetical protein AC629_24235 [Bradyrhizobium sp. NAS80.1]